MYAEAKTCDNEPSKKKDLRNDDVIEMLRSVDERLLEIAQNGNLNMLLKCPKELTKKLMAVFLGLSLKGLEQQLKEEKKHPNSYTPQKRKQ